MDLTEKILFYMKRYHMIPENKNIVVGLSGGADSVCLLYVLAALRKKLGLQLCAVHVHHGLRGVEADADEAYAVSYTHLDVYKRQEVDRFEVEVQ